MTTPEREMNARRDRARDPEHHLRIPCSSGFVLLEDIARDLDDAEAAYTEAVARGYVGTGARLIAELDVSWVRLRERARSDAHGAFGVIDILHRRVGSLLSRLRAIETWFLRIEDARAFLEEARARAQAHRERGLPTSDRELDFERRAAWVAEAIDEAQQRRPRSSALGAVIGASRLIAELEALAARAVHADEVERRRSELARAQEAANTDPGDADEARRAYAELYEAFETRPKLDARFMRSDLEPVRAALSRIRAELARRRYDVAARIAEAAHALYASVAARAAASDGAYERALAEVRARWPLRRPGPEPF